ncbi:FadR/GntR family transcriptional regulator [Aquitalea sp. LB_tupeE]|uniref:FadR/GntR family transcriptional regulator n=1 Tax=Aquitalea sp. LB_tupeE TaxID=2748078 RepID=UPI0015B89552|nr:FadR/GntR family transcriptional regulator [Aquitalea sp. LB_tupeE]NWK78453.1 FadR family transcriptional regulator [Aquitalea sp. LB_tupeE]
MPLLHQARRSLVDLAVEDIGQRLAAGQWPVDSRIPTEPELAALLGISRNTVREAVRVLLYAGLLEVRQGDGTYVRATTSPAEAMRAISRASLREQLEVRALLEEHTARLAALRASPQDVARIARLLTLRGEQQQYPDPADFINRDLDFHLAIAEASGNAALAELYRYFTLTVQDSILRTMHDEALPDPDLASHQAIVDAIAHGDGKAAGEAAAAVTQPLLQVLDSLLPPSPASITPPTTTRD